MHRLTRYTVPAALCVTLLAAPIGFAAAAGAPERPPVVDSQQQAIPGTDGLLAQAQSLGAAGGLVQPVTELVAAVLKSPDGKLPDADLAAFKARIDPAVAGLKKSVLAAPAAPAAPAVPVKPPVALPAKPPVADLPAKPPVADLPAKPPVADLPAKPPVADLPAKPPAQLPVKLPAAHMPAKPAAAHPVAAHKGAESTDLASASIDKLKGSVDDLMKAAAASAGNGTDVKTKANDVMTDLVATLVTLATGAAPAPAAKSPVS